MKILMIYLFSMININTFFSNIKLVKYKIVQLSTILESHSFQWYLRACSLVGFWAGLGWLVLVYYERKTLLAGWFGLAETNERTDCIR